MSSKSFSIITLKVFEESIKKRGLGEMLQKTLEVKIGIL